MYQQTSNHRQSYLLPPTNHEPYLMTSPKSALATPNLSPGGFSGSSGQSDHSHSSEGGRHHRHRDSLSDDDGCPTPVLSPSVRQQKETMTMKYDETQVPPGYDIRPHEAIHMPINLSLYTQRGTHINAPLPRPLQQFGFAAPFFSPSKRQERIARLRARLQQLRAPHTMNYTPVAFPPPPPFPPSRFMWCYRSYDVGKNHEPWRAFVPQNQALLWQYPGHDIHIRDPSIARGTKVITIAADRGIAYHNDPDMRAPQTFEIKLIDMAQRPVVWEPLPDLKW